MDGIFFNVQRYVFPSDDSLIKKSYVNQIVLLIWKDVDILLETNLGLIFVPLNIFKYM